MDSGYKRLFNNSLLLMVLQGVNIVAPLLILPYLTRVLDIDEFGAVMAAMASVYIGFVITDYGFSLSATYRISRSRGRSDYINNLLSTIYSAKLILIVIALILFFAISLLPVYFSFREIFWAGSLSIIFQAYQPLWLFLGLEKMSGYTIYMVLTKIVYVFFTLIFVSSSGDGVFVLFSWSFANFIGVIVSNIMVKRLGIKIGFSTIIDAIEEIKNSAQFFWSRVAVAFYTSACSVIVGTSGLHQVAMYSTSEQAYKAGQVLTSSFSQAIYPFMAKGKRWSFFNRIVLLMTILISTGGVFVASYSDFFIGLIFGEAYLDASNVLPIMMLTLVVNYLGVSFGYPALAACDKVEWANKTVIIGSIVFVIIATVLYLFNNISAVNMALLVLLIESFVFLFRLSLVVRYRLNEKKII